MKLNKKQFLGPPAEITDFKKAKVVVVPFPYEGGISYGAGTGKAPEAVIDASYFVEFYDEVLDCEPMQVGISTIEAPVMPDTPEKMIETLQKTTGDLLKQDKFVVVIGGDHSISSGFFQALVEKYGSLSVIQLDAHADLRDSYEGSPLSHACVMSRIREHTSDTLQIGIRSISKEEMERVRSEEIALYTMHDMRFGDFDLDEVLSELPDPVFITLDVDVFDWSVIRSTGTPEPGGFLWDEALDILQQIFENKEVVGFDVVELSHNESDPNSPFAIAKLIYKMIGFKYHAILNDETAESDD